MTVLVIGATGFIGTHICAELKAKAISLSVLTRSPEKAKKILKVDDASIVKGDLSRFEEINLDILFAGVTHLIFAAGIDERAEVKGDAEDFFFHYNVSQCLQVLRAAKYHGVKKATVLGSIFTYFDHSQPEIGLANHHIYIASRVKQKTLSIGLNDKDFEVSVAEIPLVLGTASSGQSPIMGLIDYCRFGNPIFCTDGGINAISVNTLAEAIVKLTFLEKAPHSIPLVDSNILWKDIAQTVLSRLNKRGRVRVISPRIFNYLTRLGGYFHEILGFQSGLNQRYVGDIVNHRFFVDTEQIKNTLGYTGGDTDLVLNKTIDARLKANIKSELKERFNNSKFQLHHVKKTLSQLLING